MKKTSFYYGRINNLIDNALLHLYLSITYSGRYFSVTKRNEVLVKYIKPKLKDRAYKYVKGEVKLLVLAGREKDADLETRLYDLKKVIANHYDNLTGIERLYELIKVMFDDHRLAAKMMTTLDAFEPNVINICKKDMDRCFNKSGEQLAPLPITGSVANNKKLYSIILDTDLFIPQIELAHQDSQNARMVLHSSLY